MKSLWMIPIVVSALACGACASNAGSMLTEFEWMLGNWIARDGAITEHWQRVSDNTFEGRGVTRSEDKVTIESLRLVSMSGESYYIAKVPHNEFPVAFRHTDELTPERAVFVNPGHDFPKRIEYERDETGAMVVTVSDGGDEGFQLRFRKSSTGKQP